MKGSPVESFFSLGSTVKDCADRLVKPVKKRKTKSGSSLTALDAMGLTPISAAKLFLRIRV
jgi:hypothetical protein